MLNTKKLLYILPDVAYVAEVLPDKKPHSFTVHSFTQINGTFIDEDTFIVEHVLKLFTKLEAQEDYHLILPDYLFTNTIVTIAEKSDQKIKDDLQNSVFPKLNLTPETHLLDSSVLNEIRGNSRVQLSAIEKELLGAIRVAAEQNSIKIMGVSPLSWVIKSLVSLEPSISVVQMGGNLYVCEHYIGIDQASNAPAEEPETIVETIKTLKGAEPSIQTVYLLSNSLIEEKLKDLLQKTLPIQQMANDAAGLEKMPAHVQEVIEYSAKTLSIADYPVPVFAVGKPTGQELEALAAFATTKDKDEEEETPDLPTPAIPAPVATLSSPEKVEAKKPEIDEVDETEQEEVEEIIEPTVKKETEKVVEKQVEQDVESTTTEDELPQVETPVVTTTPVVTIPVTPPIDTPVDDPVPATKKVVQAEQDIDLSQFVQAQSSSALPIVKENVSASKPVALPTIKNKSGIQVMLKMIFITLAVFCVTVAVGVGVGLAILKFSGSEDATQPQPSVEVQATATPVPTTPTPSPSTTPTATTSAKTTTNLKVLIVNATTKAGYAGGFKSKIEAAKLGTVTAANAKEKYTDGYLIYMKTEDSALVDKFAKAMSVELSVDKKAAAEDPQNKYDVIVVLAE